MARGWQLVVVWMAGALATGSAAAAEPAPLFVGELGEPATFHFDRDLSFADEELVAALEGDIAFQVAARPQAYFPPLLTTIADRLTLGYRNAGFPRANVIASLDASQSQIVVAVDEGPRYRCGTIRIAGARRAATDRLVAAIQHPDRDEQANSGKRANGSGDEDKLVAWQPGKPASFVPHRWKQYEPAVRQGLAEQGFHFARFACRIEAAGDDKTAALVVSIEDEGPPGVIGRIDIDGCQRHTPQQVLEFLDLGAPLDYSPDLVSEIEDKLRRSARFIYQKTTTSRPERPGDPMTLSIALREHPTIPTLDEPLPAWQETLCKLSQWLERWPDSEDDIVVGFRKQPSESRDEPHANRSELRIVARPRQGLLVHVGFDYANSNKRFEHALLATTSRIALDSPQRGQCFQAPIELNHQTGVMIHWRQTGLERKDDKQSDYNLNLGAGVQHKGNRAVAPLDFDVRVDPVTLIGRLADQQVEIKKTADELALTSPTTTLRVDRRTGRLLEWRLQDDDGGVSYQISCQPGEYDRAVASFDRSTAEHASVYDSQKPLGSLGKFLFGEAVYYGDLAGTDEQRAGLESMGRLVKGSLAACDRLWRRYASRLDRSERFDIPSDGQSGMPAMMASLTLAASHAAFPRDTPLWTLGREIAFHLTGHGRSGPREYAEIARSRTSGPLACLAGALMLKYVDAESSRRFAFFGLQRLDARSFESDCQMLLSGDCLLRETLVEAGDTLREFDDDALRLLCRAALDPPNDACLANAAIHFKHDSRPTSEALPELLATLWQASLQRPVGDWLKTLNAPPVANPLPPVGSQAP